MSIGKKHISLLLWLGNYLSLTAWFWVGYHSLTLGEEWAAWLYPEDHFFENLGALSLFLAAGLCLYAFVRGARAHGATLRTGIYLILFLSFFIGAGQETGWGQRWLNPEARVQTTPAGSQTEARQGTADRGIDPRLHPDNILNLLLIALSAGLPTAWFIFPGLRRAWRGHFPAALVGMGPLFLLNQGLAMYASESFKPWYRYKIVRFPQAVQEIKESNLELLCAILALIAVWELGRYLRGVHSLQENHHENSE